VGRALLLLIGGGLYWRSLRGSQAMAPAAAMNEADTALADRLLATSAEDRPTS
jgi:hypothetical protein